MANVLIIDDNEIFCEMLSEMVKDLGHEVSCVYTIKDGLEATASGEFEVVFLDVRLPDGNGLEVLPDIKAMPSAPLVIIITGAGDPDGADLALKNGAWDYIEKQTSIKQIMLPLVRAVQYQQEKKGRGPSNNIQEEKQGKIIGFMGAKGGVGTTTVAINVASVLAQKKKNVIAVELKLCCGTFSLIMNQFPTRNLTNLLELEPESLNPTVLKDYLQSSMLGLRILFGPQKASDIKGIASEQVMAVIKGLASLADYLVIDLFSDFSEACRSAVKCCDQVILVTEREQFSVRSGKHVMELLAAWGVSKSLIRGVITNRIILPMMMKIETIKSHLDCEIIGVIPFSQEACSMSQISGQPIVLFHQDNLAATSLIEIANKLV
jgi:MinD-like ATPase involved in chromosome partitioning or flagellar assembly/ActR/RegA family two-component response regulator